MNAKLNFDHAKCAQRRRLAARRDAVNAVPVRFLRNETPKGGRVIASSGWLPADVDQALERINALRPDPNAEPLTEDDVFIHYAEAANSNYVECYCLFMGERTLKNIAADAEAGFAFMNSHRTGGLSSPAELPFGRTFCGRYEVIDARGAEPKSRAVIGFYMMKGVRPNGVNGPSTDDLHASIAGGTIFDVSVGLWGGEEICDVCGNGLFDRDTESGSYICPHVPGTRIGMTPEQVDAQKARGVMDGAATYTLDDAHCAETSAVYDGAVPGAGFQKAMKFSRTLTPSQTAEVDAAFARLFEQQDVAEGKMSVPKKKFESGSDPCPTCGAVGCDCGSACTAKNCGCCNACKEAMSAAKPQQFKPGDPAAQQAAPDLNLLNRFMGALASVFGGNATPAQQPAASADDDLRTQLATEREGRIKAEVGNVMSKHAKKFNPTSAKRFEKLLRDASTNPQELAPRLSQELSLLADELPMPVVETRAQHQSARDVDAAADNATRRTPQLQISGEGESDSVALDSQIRSYMAENKIEFSADNYSKAMRAVLAANAGGTAAE